MRIKFLKCGLYFSFFQAAHIYIYMKIFVWWAIHACPHFTLWCFRIMITTSSYSHYMFLGVCKNCVPLVVYLWLSIRVMQYIRETRMLNECKLVVSDYYLRRLSLYAYHYKNLRNYIVQKTNCWIREWLAWRIYNCT